MTVKSRNLLGRGDICVFVPPLNPGTTNLPIYILLHGVYGSAWSWPLQGGAHLAAQQLIDLQKIQPAILAMPSDGLWGDGSAYLGHHNQKFDHWIVDDVPRAIIENIEGAGSDSPLCIGGLSMGGYGALCLGARFSHKFRAIAAHSAITKLQQLALFVEESLEDYYLENDLPDVIDVLKFHRDKLPPIRFDCGVDDNLFESNRILHQQMDHLNIPHSFSEYPGSHEWEYWQNYIRETLLFFDQICRG